MREGDKAESVWMRQRQRELSVGLGRGKESCLIIHTQGFGIPQADPSLIF